ncbi:response regulator transcription factor [Neolewinella aurantiaca]|uniref:Response regulator transcription factor n=1 Tax=Neolewinella aurantiaca TaxID=2602767 RepID=A0A5C7FW60_9BACT|nr:response regulator transcription factor [Neolewinella aurantiaca]TXF90895.1 response regulator transcription factor [Neolewinella aurantiaca]
MPVKIVLVDDHALIRDGIRSLLEGEKDLSVVGEANDGLEALEVIHTLKPDLVIIDIRMPRLDGIGTVKALKEKGNSVPCLMLSMHDSEEYVLQSIKAGAHGYLLKDASRDEFLKAIHNISNGERYFSGDLSHILVKQIVGGSAPTPSTDFSVADNVTRRQKQILKLIPSGFTNQEIADQLGLSRRTVETHRYKMMETLGVSNKGELIRKARELGLL